jgi:predicted ATPase
MQQLTSLTCKGFRGFQEESRIKFAAPNGEFGSGLTVLVGPNGGGKSTIVESLRKLTKANNTSFTEGKRNKAAGDRVEIRVDIGTEYGSLKTVSTGGSECEWVSPAGISPPKVFFLPSRRVFQPYFGKGSWGRDAYATNIGDFQYRGQSIDQFSHRLFNAVSNYDDHQAVLRRVYGKPLSWTIDQNDSGQYYVKVSKSETAHHNSDGMGEGIVSLLFLVDAIFESSAEELLVIDEPELSLHPQLQRRLLIELGNLSRDRQVMYATHSPEMISLDAVINGMEVIRVVDGEIGSKAYRLSDDCRDIFRSLEGDLFNPHSFGYESKACLFAEDRMIITEGQEDVVFFNKMCDDLSVGYRLPFWGFGAGGSGKISKIAAILKSLGFTKIGAIFDGDKASEAGQFQSTYPEYRCWTIPADDIRDKTDGNGQITKIGIYGTDKAMKAEHTQACRTMLTEVREYIDG